MRQSVRSFRWPRVLTAIGSIVAVSCSSDLELTPRPDPIARAYFDAVAPQHELDALQWPSPNRRFVAHSDSTGWAEERITVTDTRSGRVIPIVTIRETDPGSGRSHHLAWTADGAALRIAGSGALRRTRPTSLCLVYRLEEADLLSAVPCPATPGAGRSERSAVRRGITRVAADIPADHR